MDINVPIVLFPSLQYFNCWPMAYKDEIGEESVIFVSSGKIVDAVENVDSPKVGDHCNRCEYKFLYDAHPEFTTISGRLEALLRNCLCKFSTIPSKDEMTDMSLDPCFCMIIQLNSNGRDAKNIYHRIGKPSYTISHIVNPFLDIIVPYHTNITHPMRD